MLWALKRQSTWPGMSATVKGICEGLLGMSENEER